MTGYQPIPFNVEKARQYAECLDHLYPKPVVKSQPFMPNWIALPLGGLMLLGALIGAFTGWRDEFYISNKLISSLLIAFINCVAVGVLGVIFYTICRIVWEIFVAFLG